MSSYVEHPSGPGHTDGPISSDHYKRAVYRPPPSRFSVETLTPTKQGGSHSYGMRIRPISHGDRSSVSSRDSQSEYVIWRRWEDCLWFQNTLELEYKRMARQKRQRLLRGKGVRKGGLYLQDQASSFESLPPGPDPKSVASKIHEYVPQLTKKGTVFRASQATIDKRAAELKAFIQALFKDDMPALVQELRSERNITDFFGFWRRDYDLAEKERARVAKARSSVTSSVFSMYFSGSNLVVHDDRISSPSPAPSIPTGTTAQRGPSCRTLTLDKSQESRYFCSGSESANSSPSPTTRCRALSSTSSDSSEAHSDMSSDNSTIPSVPIIADDVPIMFGHNPQRRLDHFINGRPSRVLEALPEDGQVSVKFHTPNYPAPPVRRRQKNSAEDRDDLISADSYLAPHEVEHQTLPDCSIRESWQTSSSASCILEGLNVTLPTSHLDDTHRASMSSVATFMTNCSADAIIPRSPYLEAPSPSTGKYVSSERFQSSAEHEMWSDGEDNILDTYLSDYFPLPCFDLSMVLSDKLPETPAGHVCRDDSDSEEQHATCLLPVPASPIVPPSPTYTAFSMSTISDASSSATNGTLSVKAALNNSIIILRVTREISFDDMRQRIYKKFVGQEGVPLSQSFKVALVIPALSNLQSTCNRSLTLSSLDDRSRMRIVDSQLDWVQVLTSTEGSKLALRIIDTPS